jgi:hypothetical protein
MTSIAATATAITLVVETCVGGTHGVRDGSDLGWCPGRDFRLDRPGWPGWADQADQVFFLVGSNQADQALGDGRPRLCWIIT